MRSTASLFSAVFMLLTASLLSPAGHATVALDIQNGVPADQLIANALADGLTVDQIADQIAQEVGSANIGMFAGALVRTVAAATDTSPGDPILVAAVNAAVGAAAANNHPGRQPGRAYAMNSANFAPVAVASIRATTGILALSRVAPTALAGILARGPGAPGGPPRVRAGGSGGGGGALVEDAICEAIGSEPGCLDNLGGSPFQD